jgi:hypothetical protein
MPGHSTADASQVQVDIATHRQWWRKLPLRVSVRGLMILVLIQGAVLAWVVYRAHSQRDAVNAIRSCGGQVTYDWQLKRLPNGNAQFDPTGRPRAPTWLVDYLGYDFFGHVEHVVLGQKNTDAVMEQVGHLDKLRRISFRSGIDLTPVARAGLDALPNSGVSRFQGLLGLMSTDLSPPPFNGANVKYLKNMTRLEALNFPDDTSITDADLTQLIRLTALRQLNLHDPRITDAGLTCLKDMTSLTNLMLTGTQVSANGLQNLRALKKLKFLNLTQTRVDDLAPISHLVLLASLHVSQTPVGDRGLAPIVALVGLDTLRLDGTNITGASYGYFKSLSKLAYLSLQKTRIGDEGSADLAKLTALIRLDLDDTQITDNTLAHLASLPKLRFLSLARTRVTDRGLGMLTECKSLKQLNVRGSKISRDGLRAFQEARPYVNVVR